MLPETLEARLRKDIIKATKHKEFGPDVLHALIEKESSYRLNAKSPTGVHGLCQITWNTAKEISEKYDIELSRSNFLNPEIQITLSSIYLQEQLDRTQLMFPTLNKTQQLRIALHAYNSGFSSVIRAIKKGGISNFNRYLPKTADKHYAEKILGNKTWVSEVNVVEVPKKPDTQPSSLIDVIVSISILASPILIIVGIKMIKESYSVISKSFNQFKELVWQTRDI